MEAPDITVHNSLEVELVYETCSLCEGEGCVWCDETGLIEHRCQED